MAKKEKPKKEKIKPPTVTINDVLEAITDKIKTHDEAIIQVNKNMETLAGTLNQIRNDTEEIIMAKGNNPGKRNIGGIISQVFEFLNSNPGLLKGGDESEGDLFNSKHPKWKELQDAIFSSTITEIKNKGLLSSKEVALKDKELDIKNAELEAMKKRKSRFGVF
ncbi:MAG: hypothetical protein ACFFDT_07795 [Candidatus Hodarchaeota archaeon]